jgi:hypothetical protein
VVASLVPEFSYGTTLQVQDFGVGPYGHRKVAQGRISPGARVEYVVYRLQTDQPTADAPAPVDS